MAKKKSKDEKAERKKEPRKPVERFRELRLFTAFADVWKTAVP